MFQLNKIYPVVPAILLVIPVADEWSEGTDMKSRPGPWVWWVWSDRVRWVGLGRIYSRV
jgi:hypothetical protein